jgi:tRNA threonylcarbamoyladenosine biosynthesis protein TsaB
MRVLALDTTTREGSVALIEDVRVIAERAGEEARTHAERLPRELLDLLDDWGLSIADIDLFAVAAGPGSFTGLRIGIATIQGLALVEARPVVPVSALDALAQVGSTDEAPGTLIGAWMDAQRGEVFSALYRVGDGPLYDPERLVEIDAPAVAAPAITLARWTQWLEPDGVRFVGGGAERYRSRILEAGERWGIAPPRLLAAAVGRMAIAAASRGRLVHPAAIQPIYIRRPDAEIDREKRRDDRHAD